MLTNAAEIATGFLCWLLENRIGRGENAGLWGGNEFIPHDYHLKRGEEHWDIWTTTMNVVDVLITLGFTFKNSMVQFPINWLMENYSKHDLPSRRKIPILKTLYLAQDDVVNIQKMRDIVCDDIHVYLEKKEESLKEMDDDKYLNETDSETPYHLLSCYLDRNNKDGTILKLKAKELTILIKLFLRTSSIYEKREISHRLSYALVCLRQINGHARARRELSKVDGREIKEFAKRWFYISHTLRRIDTQHFCWDVHSSVTNLYQILSFIDYKDSRFFDSEQKEIIEELKGKIGVDTQLPQRDSVLYYLFEDESPFYENNKADHFKPDPKLSPVAKNTGYHTFNTAYTTAIGLKILLKLEQFDANEALTEVLCRVQSFGHFIRMKPNHDADPAIILHLSDIQCGKDSDEDLRNHFVESLGKFFEQKENQKICPNVLVVSGDLTSKGRPQEFEEFQTFVNKIAELCGIPNNRIILSPGNHDMNWDISFSRYLVDVPSEDVKPEIIKKHNMHLFKIDKDVHPIPGDINGTRIKVVGTERRKEIDLLNFTRFAPYTQFIYGFYDEKDACMSLFNKEKQYMIHVIPECSLIIVAFNGVTSVDWSPNPKTELKFTNEGMLPRLVLDAVKADIYRLLPKYYSYLRIGVLHAPIEHKSAFGRTYASSGFKVCLSGHLHESTAEGEIHPFYEGDTLDKMKKGFVFVAGTLSSVLPDYTDHSFQILGIRTFPDGKQALYPIECYFRPKTTSIGGKKKVIGGKIGIHPESEAVMGQFPNQLSEYVL